MRSSDEKPLVKLINYSFSERYDLGEVGRYRINRKLEEKSEDRFLPRRYNKYY